MKKKKRKEKILILFAGTHLAYSPTITQLYDALALFADVTILAEIAPQFISQKLTGRNVIYFEEQPLPPPPGRLPFWRRKRNKFLKKYDRQVKMLESVGLTLERHLGPFNRIKNTIKKGKYDRVIALDMENLFFCSVMRIQVDFISLELGIGEQYLPYIDTKYINCVITQSEERYDYFFKGKVIKTFIVPNSPIYREYHYIGPRSGLLYGGTAWEPFGFFKCLDYVREYPDTPLTVQGAIPSDARVKMETEYKDLLDNKLLIINEGYLNNEDVVPYFAKFEIGICFYNFEVDWIRHFNYESAPSGKMYKYLAAGIPIIANDTIGFKPVKEKNCGVLIPDLQPDTIRAGIEKIRSNYAYYASNTKPAAKHFSFDKAIQPYLDYVTTAAQN